MWIVNEQLGFHGRDHGIIVVLKCLRDGFLNDPADYAMAVREAWHMTDHCSIFLSQWTALWSQVKPDLVMNELERRMFESLPEELTLYRGYCRANGTCQGLAWALDEQLATWFSKYRSTDPEIVEMAGSKHDLIHALFEGRDGWEAISLVGLDSSGSNLQGLVVPDLS